MSLASNIGFFPSACIPFLAYSLGFNSSLIGARAPVSGEPCAPFGERSLFLNVSLLMEYLSKATSQAYFLSTQPTPLFPSCFLSHYAHSQKFFNLNFFTVLLPCLPNNLSTYGARRFHISRSEWDRVFSRLTVVPGLSWFPIDEQEGKWNSFLFDSPPATCPLDPSPARPPPVEAS